MIQDNWATASVLTVSFCACTATSWVWRAPLVVALEFVLLHRSNLHMQQHKRTTLKTWVRAIVGAGNHPGTLTCSSLSFDVYTVYGDL